ncbi:NINE protein [Cryobacterium cheniae]|uniref:NINE protein n=1 Tax=Cryobacterium cheniae TaxID=1259262 RepID=UPI00141B53B0|nr:NINE protein [Cryobacterium cheniae]
MSNDVEAPPGWYIDPNDATLYRWWNGTVWTAQSSPVATPPVQHAIPLARGPIQQTPGAKDSTTGYLLCILLGGVSAHNFYLGHIRTAIIFLLLWWGGWVLTPFGFGYLLLLGAAIMWIIDLIYMPEYVRSANARLHANNRP